MSQQPSPPEQISRSLSPVDGPRTRSIGELRRLEGVKWARYGGDVLPAWVADMDLAPPAVVVDAVQAVLDRRDFGYNFDVVDNLRPVFSQWQTRHHNWTPPVDETKVFCDVLHAIDIALWLHTRPGDGVLVLTPVYPPFITAVNGAGRRLISVPLEGPDWTLDAERLAAAVDDGTKAVLLCHPHNPTGRSFTTSEREAIAEVVVANDLLLISDEVWGDLVYDGGRHEPLATIDGLERCTLTVSSASKAFNLAGLRCAVAHIGHNGLRSMFDELPQHFLGAVATPGAVATAACWTTGEQWLTEVRSFLAARREQVLALVATRLPAVAVTPPDATYLAWLDVSALDEAFESAPGTWFLDHGGVALGEGLDFGPEGAGHVRLNFATSPEILDEIIDRMAVAVARSGRDRQPGPG